MQQNYVNNEPSDLDDKVGPYLNPEISSNHEENNENEK